MRRLFNGIAIAINRPHHQYFEGNSVVVYTVLDVADTRASPKLSLMTPASHGTRGSNLVIAPTCPTSTLMPRVLPAFEDASDNVIIIVYSYNYDPGK